MVCDNLIAPCFMFCVRKQQAESTLVSFHLISVIFAGKWQHVKDTTSIGEGKMFSPGNLRATTDNPEYAKVS